VDAGNIFELRAFIVPQISRGGRKTNWAAAAFIIPLGVLATASTAQINVIDRSAIRR
jgi:hypothetical protein